jgi:hypothetical protein
MNLLAIEEEARLFAIGTEVPEVAEYLGWRLWWEHDRAGAPLPVVDRAIIGAYLKGRGLTMDCEHASGDGDRKGYGSNNQGNPQDSNQSNKNIDD